MYSTVDYGDSRQLDTKSEGTTKGPENVISYSDHGISRNSRRSVNDVFVEGESFLMSNCEFGGRLL